MAASIGDVSKYLQRKQTESDRALSEEWQSMEELYSRRLWHQLTLKLLDFIKKDEIKPQLVEIYKNFIQDFENKINALALVEIASDVTKQMPDMKESVEYLRKIEGKVKGNNEAVALCKVLIGQITLKKADDRDAVKKIIDEVEALLDIQDGITTVHARFYLLCSDLYVAQGAHADYYRAALRYLGCVELADLAIEEQRQHAKYLSLAALLGEGVYNFGELLAHDVLNSLKGTGLDWLVKLLFAFNSGNIGEFERLKKDWATDGDLFQNEARLREKISLLCLMEMTFKRPSTNRQLSFQEIATETRLPVEQIEFLVMKALAQGLVKGQIDQVEQRVHLYWVQPRVLDKGQISGMIERIDFWCRDVQSLESLLVNKAQDILTF